MSRSGSTSSGTSAPLAPSPSTCAEVTTNAITSRTGRVSSPAVPAIASASAAPTCIVYAQASTVVRRARSMSTPANSENSSHGACPATLTSDTWRGSVVIDTASSGSAASRSPSHADPDTATACSRTHLLVMTGIRGGTGRAGS